MGPGVSESYRIWRSVVIVSSNLTWFLFLDHISVNFQAVMDEYAPLWPAVAPLVAVIHVTSPQTNPLPQQQPEQAGLLRGTVLVWEHLDGASAQEAPGHGRLRRWGRRSRCLLDLDGSEGDWHVQRRLQAGFKVHSVLLLEPASRQRQPAPWRHLQHVGHHPPVEVQTGLLPGAPSDVGETSGGVRVLPRPLKLGKMVTQSAGQCDVNDYFCLKLK